MSAPHILLAWDPGTAQSAVVAVTRGPRGRLHVVDSAMVASTPEEIDAYFDHADTLGIVDAVGIEWAEGGIFNAFRAKPLLASQGVAGEISGLAYAHGHRRERVKAQTWRDAFVGRAPVAIKIQGLKTKKNATDHMLAKAIPLLVSGCETFGAGSHRYDAAGVALWAAGIVWGPTGMVAKAIPRNGVR